MMGRDWQPPVSLTEVEKEDVRWLDDKYRPEVFFKKGRWLGETLDDGMVAAIWKQAIPQWYYPVIDKHPEYGWVYHSLVDYSSVASRPSQAALRISRMSGFFDGYEWRLPADRRGFVYFVQGEGGGPIKIGKAKNVAVRAMGMQPTSMARLQVLAIRRGGLATEKVYHHTLSSDRLWGEWFRPSQAVFAAMRAARLNRYAGLLDDIKLRLASKEWRNV